MNPLSNLSIKTMKTLSRLIFEVFQNYDDNLAAISVNVKYINTLYDYIMTSLIVKKHVIPDGRHNTTTDRLPTVYVDMNDKGQILYAIDPNKLEVPTPICFHYGPDDIELIENEEKAEVGATIVARLIDDGGPHLRAELVTQFIPGQAPSKIFSRAARKLQTLLEEMV